MKHSSFAPLPDLNGAVSAVTAPTVPGPVAGLPVGVLLCQQFSKPAGFWVHACCPFSFIKRRHVYRA